MAKLLVGFAVGMALALLVIGKADFVSSAERSALLSGFAPHGINHLALEVHEAICAHGQVAICTGGK